jgi:hypothetical protein
MVQMSIDRLRTLSEAEGQGGTTHPPDGCPGPSEAY